MADMSLCSPKYIQMILEQNAEVLEKVGTDPHKIFPLLQPDNIKFPFIVHSRQSISVEYTKELPLGWGWTNTVNYVVSCVSDDYVQCIELANAVRHALEGTRYKDSDITIWPIQLLGASEYTTDNGAFVQELIFTFKVE